MSKRKFLPLLKESQPQILERRLCEWFSSPLGVQMLEEQARVLSAVMPRLFGYYCLHAGPVCLPGLRRASTIKHHFRLVGHGGQDAVGPTNVAEPEVEAMPASLGAFERDNVLCVGRLDALPFATKSVDAVLLHHCLDIEDDPHSVLREACRVLLPGGSIVVIGFNPWSLWGLWRLVTFRTSFASAQAPWGCRFVSPYRLSDWLNLLDFEVEGCETRFFLPSSRHLTESKSGQFSRFAEQHLRAFGAAYVLVAKKREMCMTPIKPAWQGAVSPLKPAVAAHARETSTVSSLLEAKQRRDADLENK